MRIEPATLGFADDGTPRSEAFGDVYHSRDGGLAQARHVFIAGNGLPERWRGRERFTVLETGFGLGLNFLATWDAWQRDRDAPACLHYVAVELHPFEQADLAILHVRWPELADLAAELQAAWPPLTAGFHRLHLNAGRVVLTLLFGDARTLLPQLEARADAFYLDGFAPSANPELWSYELIAQLPRLAAADARAASWCVSGSVRRALAAAGFECEKSPGFGAKREMLRARHSGAAPAANAPARRAIVLGAGLAGSSVANRLAARGWNIDLVDAAAEPATGASGNLTGVLRPLPSLDDNRLARITRAGALYAARHLRRLEAAGLDVRWAPCGVLHLARDPVHEEKQRRVVETHRPPPGYLRYVNRDQASQIAGWPMAHGGWWFPDGGWINPPSLCRANLAEHPERIRGHFGRSVSSIERIGTQWVVRDPDGCAIATAPVLVLANGVGIRRLSQADALPVRSARGQVTHLPAPEGTPPEVVVCRLGYVSPPLDGIRCAGATFAVDDDDPALREADHRENLAKLAFMLPGYAENVDITQLDGRVGFRPASPDRLPMIGAVPEPCDIARGTPLQDIPRQPGLFAVAGFGARGLVWAALAGELLASMLCGDPLPIERELAEAMDPTRFLTRPPRRAVSEE